MFAEAQAPAAKFARAARDQSMRDTDVWTVLPQLDIACHRNCHRQLSSFPVRWSTAIPIEPVNDCEQFE
eukprot:6178087-Pleurochrysis_carterae.AAC.5